MSYKLRIGFESKKKIGFTMEFINIELFGSTRTGKRNFQRHAGVRFVYACFAVRAGNRAGVKYLEEPSPLDNTSDDADGTRIFSK